MRYGMAIDLRRCFGCQTCAVACKVANNMPKNVAYNVVYTKIDNGDIDAPGLAVHDGALSADVAGGTFPDCSLYYLPRQCQHCDNPACRNACPTGATQIREDGIVWIDEELCIGCKSCIEACPYEGVLAYSRRCRVLSRRGGGGSRRSCAHAGHCRKVHVLLQSHRPERSARLHAAMPWTCSLLG